MEAICKAVSSGSLRGARGNSGVILSLLFRGMSKALKEHNQADGVIFAAAVDGDGLVVVIGDLHALGHGLPLQQLEDALLIFSCHAHSPQHWW